ERVDVPDRCRGSRLVCERRGPGRRPDLSRPEPSAASRPHHRRLRHPRGPPAEPGPDDPRPGHRFGAGWLHLVSGVSRTRELLGPWARVNLCGPWAGSHRMLVSRPSRGDLMSQVTNAGDLPLLSRTPDSWAGAVIKDVLALLNDHAYLETENVTATKLTKLGYLG